MNEGRGGEVEGNVGERGDSVRGIDVLETPNDSLSGVSELRDAERRGTMLPSSPEDLRAKGLRAVPGGCRVSVG